MKATPVCANFSDGIFNIVNGRRIRPDRGAGQKEMQAYFDASTSRRWDGISPPIIRVSDNGTTAYILAHKKLRLLFKN